MWFSRIMQTLMPKKDEFFVQFEEQANIVEQAVALFAGLAQDFNQFEQHAVLAKTLEREGDGVTLKIIRMINENFITPFDKEDMQPLAHDLDEITDLIERAIKEIYIYDITVKPEALDVFVPLMRHAATQLILAVQLFEKKRYTPEFADTVYKIREIEHQADDIYAKRMRELFANENDPLIILKLNRVIKNLEGIIDAFQKVADRLEGIVLKWS